MRRSVRTLGASALGLGAVLLPAAAGAVVTGTVPGAPTGVAAAQLALAPSINVSWTAPASNGGQAIKSYTATATPSAGAASTCSPKPPTSTTCTILGLSAGTSYTVKVVATNKIGSSNAGSAPGAVTPRANALFASPSLALNDPDDIAYDGTNVWTVNYNSSSFTEMTTAGRLVQASSTGATLTEIKGADTATYSGPDPIAGAAVSDGSRVLQVNAAGTVALSVTTGSKNATYVGSVDPIVGGTVTGTSVPGGTDVKSVNRAAKSVVLTAKATHTTSSSGGASQSVPKNVVLSAKVKKAVAATVAPDGLNEPFGIVVVGSDIFISNAAGGADGSGSITEIGTDGTFIRCFSNATAAYGFDSPAFLASDGTHVWVTNSGPEVYGGYNGSTVTEINVTDGSPAGVLGSGYQFAGPTGVAVIGSNVWVANYTGGTDGNGSVTIFDKDTNVVQSILTNTAGSGDTADAYNFGQPYAFTVDGAGNVWVANGSGTSDTSCGQAEGCGSVTEVSSTGSLVANYHRTSYGLNDPAGIAYDGNGHIWVANYGPVTASRSGGGHSIFEINAADGTLVRSLSDASFGLCTPNTLRYFASALWAPNGCTNVAKVSGIGSVTKIVP